MSLNSDWFIQKGELVQQLRQAKFPNDTQATFAARVGVGVTTIQNLEAGKEGVAWSTVFKVLELLGKERAFDELFSVDQHTDLITRTTSW